MQSPLYRVVSCRVVSWVWVRGHLVSVSGTPAVFLFEVTSESYETCAAYLPTYLPTYQVHVNQWVDKKSLGIPCGPVQ